LTTEDIRKAFLNYFEGKGHTIVDSASLIPAGDPTLLFINAGMVPFKDTFLGTEERAYSRATSCQKCLRISGKHNDLENVGRTARHHTFFEMLGNFSFGDYFKQDAICFGWEFVTEVLKLPKERLWVTVFQDDDEAAELWRSNTDVNPDRILRCGEKDNFWAMGDTGPCGPCSEIFYYLGDDVDAQSEAEFRLDDGTYVEIWNLVFMQYNRDPQGNLNPLPKPSVDTGMGLERVAAVVQGKTANYDSDLLREIISFVEELSKKKYLGEDYTERDTQSDEQYAFDVAMRVIADHVRACSFLIADGVNPGSDGRGYVLRRLLRRACRHGRVLGLTDAFLYKVSGKLVDLMKDIYPELSQSADKISKMIKAEEEKFLSTLDSGLQLLEKEVASVIEQSSKVFPGDKAFVLHDTYGFPLDMTEDIVAARGLTVDKEGFSAEMELQRERSRSARANEVTLLLQKSVKPSPTNFMGYDFLEYESEIVGLYGDAGELKTASTGDDVAIVVRETPFYGEAGGQLGDTGSISSNNASIDVIDTQKIAGDTIVHIARVIEGEISSGDGVRLAVDEGRRERIRAHHSATHLLHQALRETLGEHVKQAGSRVSDVTLRFDFSHYEQVQAQQLNEIQSRVNELVRENHQIVTEVLPIEEAKQSGAVALFGEKYGDTVRVVQMGPGSREFCGGTHANRVGDIGLVSIVSESAVAAGVRRIECVAGSRASARAAEQASLLKNLSSLFNTNEGDLLDRVTRANERSKELEREIARLSQTLNQSKGSDLTKDAITLENGTKVVTGALKEVDPKQLREMADDLRSRLGSGCIALGSVHKGKLLLLTAVTDDLTKKYHAGNLMRELSTVVGGKGGGRPDLAQAGGGDPEKLDQALEKFQELLA
jgi:alanyl-tRNA synthetase